MSQKLLTSLELKVMNLLWQKEKAFVKELIEDWNESPKPAYNTVSTVVRILEEKGFVAHQAFGRSHQYHPVVSQEDYQKRLVRSVLDSAFSGSVVGMISTLVDNESISKSEMDDLRRMIDDYEEQ